MHRFCIQQLSLIFTDAQLKSYNGVTAAEPDMQPSCGLGEAWYNQGVANDYIEAKVT